MAKLSTNLHCNACENGIVTLIVRSSRGRVGISVKGCNVCGKSFGVKSLSTLRQVIPPVSTSV